MTEAEWLASDDPAPMLKALRGYGRVLIGTPSARRERLFGCACCRRVQDVFPRIWDRAVLEIVERFADGNASDQELQEASQIVEVSRRDVSRRLQIESRSGTRRADARTEAERSALRELSSVIHLDALETCGRDAAQAIGGLAAAAALRTAASEWEVMEVVFDATRAERSAQAVVVRDIFESEFRSVIFSPQWRTSTAVALWRRRCTSRASSVRCRSWPTRSRTPGVTAPTCSTTAAVPGRTCAGAGSSIWCSVRNDSRVYPDSATHGTCYRSRSLQASV